MNAFQSVKPRGADAPTALPKRTNSSKAPRSGNLQKALNQPPAFGRITSVPAKPTSCPVAEKEALEALRQSKAIRAKRAGSVVFDRGVKS